MLHKPFTYHRVAKKVDVLVRIPGGNLFDERYRPLFNTTICRDLRGEVRHFHPIQKLLGEFQCSVLRGSVIEAMYEYNRETQRCCKNI